MTSADCQRTDICAIVPCYNEARSIRCIVSEIREHLATVLVVDDGSSDATIHEAETAGAIVLKQSHNMGKGAALKAGFAWAAEHNFKAAITLDGDGQHDTGEIPLFLKAFDAD